MIEQVPERVRRDAVAAFDRREQGAVVADLVLDELPDDQVRRLRFATQQLQIDVEVRRAKEALDLDVTVHPPELLDVAVRHSGPPLHAPSGSDGRCRVAPVQPGLVSLLLKPARFGRVVPTQTSWVLL